MDEKKKLSKSASRAHIKAEKIGRTQNFKPRTQSKGPGKNKI